MAVDKPLSSWQLSFLTTRGGVNGLSPRSIQFENSVILWVGSPSGTGDGWGEGSRHLPFSSLLPVSPTSSSLSPPSLPPFQFALLYFFNLFTFIFMPHSHSLAPPHSHRRPFTCVFCKKILLWKIANKQQNRQNSILTFHAHTTKAAQLPTHGQSCFICTPQCSLPAHLHISVKQIADVLLMCLFNLCVFIRCALLLCAYVFLIRAFTVCSVSRLVSYCSVSTVSSSRNHFPPLFLLCFFLPFSPLTPIWN